MVYSTRRFVLCLTLCCFVLVFSVLLESRLPRLGKRELILVLFVRFSICACLVLSVSSFSWCLGRTAVCGTPWTFLLPFSGVKSSKIREKLINEGSDLILQKCLDVARTYKLSQQHLKVIGNQASSHTVRPKRPGKRQPRGRSEQRPTITADPRQQSTPATRICDYCGRNHGKRNICPAKGQNFNYCFKSNHFASVCRSKIKDSKMKVNEVINNESDLELTPGEHSDFFHWFSWFW